MSDPFTTDGTMCPHCGALCGVNKTGLTRSHSWPLPTRQPCPGSGQNPRYAYSDARPLWNGEPNPHIERGQTATSQTREDDRQERDV